MYISDYSCWPHVVLKLWKTVLWQIAPEIPVWLPGMQRLNRRRPPIAPTHMVGSLIILYLCCFGNCIQVVMEGKFHGIVLVKRKFQVPKTCEGLATMSGDRNRLPESRRAQHFDQTRRDQRLYGSIGPFHGRIPDKETWGFSSSLTYTHKSSLLLGEKRRHCDAIFLGWTKTSFGLS